MKSILLNGSTLYVYEDDMWSEAPMRAWIMKAIDEHPSDMDEYLSSIGIHRVNMERFNYYGNPKLSEE